MKAPKVPGMATMPKMASYKSKATSPMPKQIMKGNPPMAGFLDGHPDADPSASSMKGGKMRINRGDAEPREPGGTLVATMRAIRSKVPKV